MTRLGVRSGISTSVAVLIFGTLLLVVIVNAMVYALYKFHLNSMVWFLLTQGAAMETLSFSSQTWITADRDCAQSLYATKSVVLLVDRARDAVALRPVRRYAIARACASASSRSSSTLTQMRLRNVRC